MARVYGIHARSTYAYYQDWEGHQLDLLAEAAGDFARQMQGEEASFKAKVAPVLVYTGRGGTRPQGKGGMTYLTHITLSGLRRDWFNEPGMKWVIVHELAHWWDQKNLWGLSRQMLARGMWRSDLALCRVPREERGSARPTVRQWLRGREEPSNVLEDWADSAASDRMFEV